MFGTESAVEIYRKLLGIVGAGRLPSPGSPGAALHGELERAGRQAQINTFGGGVNEVQREILATAGLGMKRTCPVSAADQPRHRPTAERPCVGQARRAPPPPRASDPVNEPMISHWVEAMGDFNPVYVDDDAARAAGFPGIIAPPTMLQAWIMRGLRASLEADAARDAGREAAPIRPATR